MSRAFSLIPSFFLDPEHFSLGVWGVLFGEEIQFRRQERGFSIEDAAERAGNSVEEWRAIEAGQVPELWEQLCAVGDGLGEERLTMASLVILYAGAWEDFHGLPDQVRHMYS